MSAPLLSADAGILAGTAIPEPDLTVLGQRMLIDELPTVGMFLPAPVFFAAGLGDGAIHRPQSRHRYFQ
jgi:hypothetical protein